MEKEIKKTHTYTNARVLVGTCLNKITQILSFILLSGLRQIKSNQFIYFAKTYTSVILWYKNEHVRYYWLHVGMFRHY